MLEAGRSFYKMSGSGNDFVFIDTRSQPAGRLEDALVIRSICARGIGVGADGIVFLGLSRTATVAMRYLNSDGSPAALCGNATLCAARLAVELGLAPIDREFSIETDSGIVIGRLRHGLPEIDLQPVTEVRECFEAEPTAGEQRLGFAVVGVPHVVILCDDVDAAPVVSRGRQLRHDRRLPHGANVNFVSRFGTHWKIRTYERGVENETLACGTGSVATALLLAAWGAVTRDAVVEIITRSDRVLRVRHRAENGRLFPSLSGEARMVFVGQLGEL